MSWASTWNAFRWAQMLLNGAKLCQNLSVSCGEKAGILMIFAPELPPQLMSTRRSLLTAARLSHHGFRSETSLKQQPVVRADIQSYFDNCSSNLYEIVYISCLLYLYT